MLKGDSLSEKGWEEDRYVTSLHSFKANNICRQFEE